jgi:hypothetical protein
MSYSFFKYYLTVFLLIVDSGYFIEPVYGSEPAKHPNIVMFLVDDMGWQDTSASSVCSPTWVSLMSGMNAALFISPAHQEPYPCP